ncbi:MAG: Arc family DNA-binding protein [Chromatiales bacterium]|jgi:hypothetical protein|nr:Arc family DNA-binding protein [Chromatiales bacterium]
MGREINPFGLRMPEDLKRRLARSAKTNRRSMNAELVLRLQHSVVDEPSRLSEIREAPGSYALHPDQVLLLERYDSLSLRRRKALIEFLKDTEDSA